MKAQRILYRKIVQLISLIFFGSLTHAQTLVQVRDYYSGAIPKLQVMVAKPSYKV